MQCWVWKYVKIDSEQIDQHDETDAKIIFLEEDADKSITQNDLNESFKSIGISPILLKKEDEKSVLMFECLNRKGKFNEYDLYNI